MTGIVGLILGIISIITIIWKLGFEWSATKNDIKSAKETAERLEKTLKEHLEDFRRISGKIDESCPKIDLFWDLVKQNLPNLLSVQRSENVLLKLANDTITDEELEYLEKEVRKLQPKDSSALLSKILALWQITIKRKERGI